MSLWRILVASALVSATMAFVPVASAQLAPGLRTPETKLDAVVQAHSMSCFLAVAARPVPGLNMDMPDNMGEGHFVEEQAPEWLSNEFEFDEQTNFSRATSPQGNIWIAFEMKSRKCLIATETNAAADIKAGLVEKVLSGKDWKPKKIKSDQPTYYQMELAGLKLRTEFPKLPTDSNIFAVELTAN